jgi:diguanylate cyclase (GGDEF)-like protein
MNYRMLLRRHPVPAHQALLVLGGTGLAAVAIVLFPDTWVRFALLPWLAALVPPFLLAYFRGWTGAAAGFLLGIAGLAMAQLATLSLGQAAPRPPLVLTVAATLLLVAIGVGVVTELLHRERERALQLALTDDVTGLPNRRYARLVLEREFAAARRGRQLVLALLEPAGLDGVRRRHGQQAAEEAVAAFGQALQATTRTMNLSARYDGHTFCTILSGADLAGATVFVGRVRGELAAGGGAEPLRAVAGLAAFDDGFASIDDLIRAAERALEAARQEGPEALVAWTPEGVAAG